MEEQDLSFLSRQMNSIAAPDAHDSVSMSGLHFGEDGYSVTVYNMAQQLFSRKLKGKGKCLSRRARQCGSLLTCIVFYYCNSLF